MKRALWLLCCSLGLGCSAAEPGGAAGGLPGAAAGTAGKGGAGNGSGSGGMQASGGSGGVAPQGGSQSAGGLAGSTAGGVSSAGRAGGGSESGGGANGGGANGGAGASAGGANGCVPAPNGALSIVGDTVHDAKTCLDWMKTTKTGVNYAAAEMFCNDATTGDYDDWRMPTASELASTITLCGKYPPEGPNDTKFFDQQGDGYWTSTPAGELNKVCAIGMLNAGGYYHFGTAGPQVVRCVRGTGSVPMVKDCTVAQGCMGW